MQNYFGGGRRTDAKQFVNDIKECLNQEINTIAGAHTTKHKEYKLNFKGASSNTFLVIVDNIDGWFKKGYCTVPDNITVNQFINWMHTMMYWDFELGVGGEWANRFKYYNYPEDSCSKYGMKGPAVDMYYEEIEYLENDITKTYYHMGMKYLSEFGYSTLLKNVFPTSNRRIIKAPI